MKPNAKGKAPKPGSHDAGVVASIDRLLRRAQQDIDAIPAQLAHEAETGIHTDGFGVAYAMHSRAMGLVAAAEELSRFELGDTGELADETMDRVDAITQAAKEAYYGKKK